jgi:hypothetical protein
MKCFTNFMRVRRLRTRLAFSAAQPPESLRSIDRPVAIPGLNPHRARRFHAALLPAALGVIGRTQM